MLTRTTETAAITVVAAITATTAITVVTAITASTTTARWTSGAATTATLATRPATLVSALFVPVLTSMNKRSTAAVRHMKAVSRNGQYCCCAEREKI